MYTGLENFVVREAAEVIDVIIEKFPIFTISYEKPN
jgi:hypothetical protein